MPNVQPAEVDADWWPNALSRTDFDAMFMGDHLRLGQVEFGDNRFHLTVVAMLLGGDELEVAKSITGRFDLSFRVAEPDLSPLDDRGPFEPRSGFHLPGIGRVETLVGHLERSQWDYSYPSPEFLTTYGLMPENVGVDGGIVYMYPTGSRSGVVRVGPASRRGGWGNGSTAVSYVSADRDFVQDYCTLRRKHLVVAYFLHTHESVTPTTDSFLGYERGWKSASRPGRHVALYRLTHGAGDEAKVEIWGIHGPIVSPGDRPISDDEWDYSDLEWPAGTGAIEDGFVENVYVKDTVLDVYIQESERYDINAVSGSVGLGYQWSVVCHGRRGRDAIEVDLKRLQEGTRLSVARHWNQHAVPRPGRDTWNDPNIASRTADAVAAMRRLAQALSQLTDGVSVEQLLPPDIIQAQPDGENWPQSLLAAAAPAPLNLLQRKFFERGLVLYDATIDQISERSIRRVVERLAPAVAALRHVKEMRSITLLGLIDELARTAHAAGLRMPGDISAVLDRLGWPDGLRADTAYGPDVAALRLLNAIRVEQAHKRAGAANLSPLNAEPRGAVVAWGEVLDRLYESVTNSFNTLAQLLEGVT